MGVLCCCGCGCGCGHRRAGGCAEGCWGLPWGRPRGIRPVPDATGRYKIWSTGGDSDRAFPHQSVHDLKDINGMNAQHKLNFIPLSLNKKGAGIELTRT
eukprot:1157789-Pelagomonas_calceolata.AAC.4